jgi:hypothetical protein
MSRYMTNDFGEIEEMIAKLEAKREALIQAIAGLRAVIGIRGSDGPIGGGTPREIQSEVLS